MIVRTPGKPGKPGIHLDFDNFTWKTLKPRICLAKLKEHLEFEILHMIFYFTKILMRLIDFRKLQSIDQRLPFWKACVKSTWNFTVLFEFYTWKFGIFHLENLEFSFEKSCVVFKQSLLILNTS